jgi:hypothetical protein
LTEQQSDQSASHERFPFSTKRTEQSCEDSTAVSCHRNHLTVIDWVARGAVEPMIFRQFAEECRRLADQVRSIEDKSVLLSMAQVWIQLADQEQQVYRLIGESSPQSS